LAPLREPVLKGFWGYPNRWREDGAPKTVHNDREEKTMAGSGQISEHEHQSKAKGQHPMTQIATRSLFENQDVRVWEMDVPAGETFGLHHHTNDYVLYITGGANLRVDDKDSGAYDFIGHERSVFYIKAGGTESFRNVSSTPFREALIEIKRPARPGQDRAGFTCSEALVGAAMRPGSVCVLENDRMRAVETTLPPGESLGMPKSDLVAAVFVVQPGKVKVIEGGAAERVREETRNARDVCWQPAGVERELVNVGSSLYREIRVEVK
jgi:quercetin dioxygenase-like cupin family protein